MRILLFGDGLGIPQLLSHIPQEFICGIVVAVNRPQYHKNLRQIAAAADLPLVVQPLYTHKNYANFHSWVEEVNPDLIWVNSYSMVVRDDILKIARLGGINIHGALLPQYRGCNPTQWAVLNGETVTGVTLHEMTSGIDEGAIIDQMTVPIYFADTWQTIQTRIYKATDKLISKNLLTIISGQWQSTSQLSEKARYYRRRTPEDGLFDWSQPVYKIYNLIRVLVSPHPGAFYLDDENNRVTLDHYMTPAEITALKYSDVGKIYIHNEKVKLRPLSLIDIELLRELNYKFFGSNDPDLLMHDTENKVFEFIIKRRDILFFVIEDIASDLAIGYCQFLNINWASQNAELQLDLDQSKFYDKEIKSESVKLLCNFGFKDLNLHKIYIHILSNNKHDITIYKENKFIEEGTLRETAYISNKFVDVVCMGLLKSEYK